MSATNQPSTQTLADRLPILCLVTDLGVAGGSIPRLADTVHDAVAGGVNMVQIRLPDADGAQFREATQTISAAVNARALLIANIGHRAIPDPPLPVDGLHFPEAAKAAVQQAKIQPATANLLAGYSAHTAESVAASNQNGADYVIVGTTFPSDTHPNGQAQGLPFIRTATDSTDTPIIAIGGITTANAASVIQAGASGIAVIRSIATASNPQQAATDISTQIQHAWHQRT